MRAEKNSGQMMKRVSTIYEDSKREIEKEINAFYGKYATKTGLSFEEAKKRLSKSELKRAKDQIKDYYDFVNDNAGKFDPAYKEQLKELSAKTYMSRLEELQSAIKWNVENLYSEQKQMFNSDLGETYKDSYNRTMFNIQNGLGYGSPFTSINQRAVNIALNTKWLEGNYSSRTWQNKDRLMLSLDREIPQGFILGHNPKKIAKTISENLGVSYRNAERLARTEFNYIANQGSIDSYEEAGIEKYKIISTLDNRTSYICQGMDGKIFNLGEEKVGITFPPFHPNCRTTTIPYFPPDEIDAMFERATRIAKNPTGEYYYVPADMAYQEWDEKYN